MELNMYHTTNIAGPRTRSGFNRVPEHSAIGQTMTPYDTESITGPGLINDSRPSRQITRRNVANNTHAVSNLVDKYIKSNQDLSEPAEKWLLGPYCPNGKRLNIYRKKHRYEINQLKALKKKHQAAERPIMCESQENEGFITINCQAGVYELIKRAILLYYAEGQNQSSKADIEVWQDKALNFTQTTIKVQQVHSARNIFTINLYHTTSTLTVNGRETKRFFEYDWPSIDIIVMEINEVCKNTDPKTLNENIKICLQQALAVLSKPKSKPSNTRGARGESRSVSDCPQLQTNQDSEDPNPVLSRLQQTSPNPNADLEPPTIQDCSNNNAASRRQHIGVLPIQTNHDTTAQIRGPPDLSTDSPYTMGNTVTTAPMYSHYTPPNDTALPQVSNHDGGRPSNSMVDDSTPEEGSHDSPRMATVVSPSNNNGRITDRESPNDGKCNSCHELYCQLQS